MITERCEVVLHLVCDFADQRRMVIHIQQRALELVAGVQEDGVRISFLHFFYVFRNSAVTAFAVAFRDAGASVFTACKVRVHVVSMQDFNGYFLFVVY